MFMNAMMDAAAISMNNARERKHDNAWKAYAKSIEANLAGSEAVKQTVLQELARLDPKNYLLIQQNRQRIFDAAYDAVLAGR